MMVASKPSSLNQLMNIWNKLPSQQNECDKTSNSCFIVKLVLITVPNSGYFASYSEESNKINETFLFIAFFFNHP